MATNTYVALDKVTVGTAVSSVTFNSVNQGYTDLILVANFDGSASSYVTLTFNGVTGTSYSRTRLIGNGSSATSDRTANTSGVINLTYNTSGTPVTGIYQIMNYSNTTTYKTVLCRDAAQPDNVAAHVGMFRGSTGSSTEAITSITLTKGSGNFTTGSTFSLYGIKAESVKTAKATGGTISYGADGYTYHTFKSTGTFTPSQALLADVLIIAGGGAGGGAYGGGGGAGGLRGLTSQSFSSGTGYTCTVGAGGSASTGTYPSGTRGGSGTNSTITGTGFTTISATGGGGGGTHNTANSGASGGSGGGVSLRDTTGTVGSGNAGSYSPVEGYAGGQASPSGTYSGGGGGGAGGVGGTATTTAGGAGGIGSNTYYIWASATSTGISGYYAGGGGGGTAGTIGAGGTGGGGSGSTTTGSNGTVNTGSGGGGSGTDYSGTGSTGGSGLVIIRYAS